MNKHWMSEDICLECGDKFWVGCSMTHGSHWHVGRFELCDKCGKVPSILDKWRLREMKLVLAERIQQVVYRLTHPVEWAAWKARDNAREAKAKADYEAMMKPTWDYHADCEAKGIKPKTFADYADEAERSKERSNITCEFCGVLLYRWPASRCENGHRASYLAQSSERWRKRMASPVRDLDEDAAFLRLIAYATKLKSEN